MGYYYLHIYFYVISILFNTSSGFTEAESLQLFSSYLKVPSDYLPAEARAIHEECKVIMDDYHDSLS